MLLQTAAEPELIFHVEERLRQLFGIFAGGAKHVERNAAARTSGRCREVA